MTKRALWISIVLVFSSCAAKEPKDKIIFWQLASLSPLVIYQNCLYSNGVSKIEFEDGSIQGGFRVLEVTENSIPYVKEFSVYRILRSLS
jgi:hypothetical protein